MPKRGNAGGQGGPGGIAGGPGHGRAGKGDGGVDMGVPEQHGRSESSPGHLKKAAGEQSARDFAPGHGGQAPGQIGRDRGENAAETPEPDSLEREG